MSIRKKIILQILASFSIFIISCCDEYTSNVGQLLQGEHLLINQNVELVTNDSTFEITIEDSLLNEFLSTPSEPIYLRKAANDTIVGYKVVTTLNDQNNYTFFLPKNKVKFIINENLQTAPIIKFYWLKGEDVKLINEQITRVNIIGKSEHLNDIK